MEKEQKTKLSRPSADRDSVGALIEGVKRLIARLERHPLVAWRTVEECREDRPEDLKAIAALGNLGKRARGAVPFLLELLERIGVPEYFWDDIRDNYWQSVDSASQIALSKIAREDEETFRRLARDLNEREREGDLRLKILHILWLMGPDPAGVRNRALRALRSDRDEKIRRAAAEILAEIGKKKKE